MGSSEVRRQVVVCDASPLIFLAKLDLLELIAKVARRQIVVLECVAREVLSKQATPIELQRLQMWIQKVEVIDYEGSTFASDALSRSDHSTLAWAVENRAEWMIADERLLRRFAQAHGIKVMGFCGILMQAERQDHLSAERARECVNTAIREHGLRISIALYQRILSQLGGP